MCHGCAVVWLGAWLAGAAAERGFDIAGQVSPEMQASVSLYGVSSPFTVSTLSDAHGRFRFSRIAAGQYTVAAFALGHGEKRSTIDVSPSTAGTSGRYEVTIRFDPDYTAAALGSTVSASELAIPASARKQYRAALKRLAKRDTHGAIEHLSQAVALAPGYTAAWNNLGTIAYQTRKYEKAEEFFRKALLAGPGAFEPLVNLGGVLLTLEKTDEAYRYNLYAVLARPRDALANSQLGMNYFALGKMDLAEKYLAEAGRLDPAHFSHPQLLLAEIYLRRRDFPKAASQLETFLQYHPDWPAAGKMREAIARLRRR